MRAFLALLLLTASPVAAQEVNSTNTTTSTSQSSSGSISGAAANSEQSQNTLQGNAQAITFNNVAPDVTEFRTNAPVHLVASSSFSSDYCGSSASAGASVAPLGISLGGSGPVYDKSCQSLRRAEKFGMAAANYYNMQQPEMAMKLMSLMVWSICTADTAGPKADRATAQACDMAGLLGSSASPGSPPPANAPEPTERKDGKPQPEVIYKSQEVVQPVHKGKVGALEYAPTAAMAYSGH
jgi:hypothetical protein